MNGLFGRAVAGVARAAGRIVPAPPSLRALGAARAEAVERALSRRRDAIAEAQRTFAADRPRGRALLGQLGEEVLAELRADRPRSLVAALAARADALLAREAEEHIDDPRLSDGVRAQLIDQLDGLNRALDSYGRFAGALAPLIEGGATTVVDVASGHGGFAIALAEQARARGQRLRIIATDLRDEYLAIGRRRAAERGLDVEFRVVDALELDRGFVAGEVDVVTCTLSLHHFGANLVVGLIAEALRIARRGILFVDALRSASRLAAVAPLVAALTLDRRSVHDAAASVRRSYVPEELAALARIAPRGDTVRAFYLPPAFVALRSM